MLPIGPYLNCSAGSAKWTGSVRASLLQPIRPIAAPAARSAASPPTRSCLIGDLDMLPFQRDGAVGDQRAALGAHVEHEQHHLGQAEGEIEPAEQGVLAR